ncbi:MAG: hypothetical protein QF673_02030 [Candidatus Hydrothermarchaeota archaeon]|jgi:ATP-dependent exoDNAse (exonuclease V) beta subunit|nr:hypothetical protein [Candidatus Hydrothermarchaeota archaeon]
MFDKAEFDKALEAYKRETRREGKDEFTALRKSNAFFNDIRTQENLDEQIKLFINIISSFDRDNYVNRYVVQTFIHDFCKFLDKDFLFFITNSSFFHIKEKIKEFTGEIYEITKNYTQRVSLNSLDHLLQDYSTLLKFTSSDYSQRRQTEESVRKGGESLWGGNKLW